MLNQIIEATKLAPEFCAGLLRVPTEHFQSWIEGRQPLPHFVVPELSAVLGLPESSLLKGLRSITGDRSALAPAIWFKLRSNDLNDADREFVALVRRLGFFISQLDEISGLHNPTVWRAVAQTVATQIDRTAPPVVQGQAAAALFRSAVELEHGKTGVGELIRSRLRQKGVLIIESPIPKSSLEGCCFNVGRDEHVVPFCFANSYKSTWFRRNEILLHEVCHAIFDIENDPVSLDFRKRVDGESALAEARAEAFAQDVFVPRPVLLHYTNQLGIQWAALTPRMLALLMAQIHVEQKTIVRAAYDNGLIGVEELQWYTAMDCAAELREVSDHALTTREYLRRQTQASPKWIAENRKTVGLRSIRLPVGYVDRVIKAVNGGDISEGKAAEMLMVDRYTFLERYGELLNEPEPV